jgi:membrane protease YdiL (CAAX protease family)
LYLILARLGQLFAATVFGVLLATILMVVWADRFTSPEILVQQLAVELSNVTTFSPLAFGFRVYDTLVVLAIIFLFRRFIDRRPMCALGLDLTRGWWQEVLAGFALIVIAWGVIFALTLGTGAATVVGFAWERDGVWTILLALASGLLFNVFVGIAEEADARGYVLQNLAEGIRFVPAVLVSSLYFSVLHGLNPGAGIASTLGIFFAGILLALGYAATRRLWFPIGMHAAWNFAEGPLFGFPVSGLDMGGVFRLNITGPEWLTGGAFGPEAGALAIGVEIALIVGLWWWIKRRG